jgi:hypothetical protein
MHPRAANGAALRETMHPFGSGAWPPLAPAAAGGVRVTDNLSPLNDFEKVD